ncbi:MAG: class I SAM-dependent methyltransferase [Saprospiraceae bacterium]
MRENITKCEVCQSDNIRIAQTVTDHSISKEKFNIAECQDCGFTFTQNPPLEAECGIYYQSEDYISHSNTNKGIIFRVYHMVRKIMLGQKSRLLKKYKATPRLLDIGSGTGYFLKYMSDHGYEVEGIEVDDGARAYSQENFKLKVNPPDILKNGGIKQQFGYITLWHVLEHLYGPNEYWQIFHQLLEASGYLLVAVPNHLSSDAKHYGEYWAAYDVPRHLWHFNPHTLSLMAENNGFEVIDKKMMPFDPFYNSMLSEKYMKNTAGLFRGGWTGLISLIQGAINVNKASSIIYVLKKK